MSRQHRQAAGRWVGLAAALSAVWLIVPGNVPLYDGIGFVDEPYRLVPATDPSLPAATTARVTLRLVNGVNPGGLVGNSAERGPQVSFFAPPQAFSAVPTESSLAVSAEPVPPVAPLPPGRRVSNSYQLRFQAGGAQASLRPAAQQPAITMRATSVEPPEPVFVYRADPAMAWRTLDTQRVGADIFTAKVPGAGEFVLSSIPRPPARKSSGNGTLLVLLAVALAVVAAALVAVRVASSRRA